MATEKNFLSKFIPYVSHPHLYKKNFIIRKTKNHFNQSQCIAQFRPNHFFLSLNGLL